ncbi:PQQ-dependent sugar dehydrogenase [Verrucomicrobiales bacterium]|jgi:cytochrome c|nr:PQQ-dependent sugar dehydrogenase [Verrucomicrobiales bacterium]
MRTALALYASVIVAVAAPYQENRFTATLLAKDLQRPLELDVAPDGRVFFIELEGKLQIYHPDTRHTTIAAELEVFAKQEAGLIGLTLDPNFSENQWLYLMYSPPTEVFVGQFVSRFTLKGDVLAPGSEKVVLKVPTHRDDCCHHAGSLEFGPDGNLFISTGDNTHPGGDSGGYAPLDEREGKHVYDAQDTAGNTNDLRGKILRIRPQADGEYAIPEGNLFPAGGPISGKPEIYVMGCRNPWRMNVDQRTGYVYWGDVGPDAGGESDRGPRGYDELNQARAAGNFGWPFFIGDNRAYSDWDFETKKAGPLYDVGTPENRSPTNTGSKILPTPQPAWIFYPYADSKEFSMLGKGGRTACAGPVYHFDPTLKSPTKLPEELDRSLIFFDWERKFIKRVKLDGDSNIVSIEPFLTELSLNRPVDMRIGPEGALYMLDYGTTWGINAEARLLRIDYHPGNRPPDAKILVTSPTEGKHPLTATFTAVDSSDPDAGDTLSFRWEVLGAEFESQSTREATFILNEPGEYDVRLTVTDDNGAATSESAHLVVGNEAPSVRFLAPVDGGFFDWGSTISYEVAVDDAEDGSSRETADFMRSRLLLNQFFHTDTPGNAEAAYLSGSGQHAGALSLIQKSDCLNCHAINRRVVGPSFAEIALRYADEEDQEAAVHKTANRIINGSSKVWGEIPMLPHIDLSRQQAASIVRWIYSLKDSSQRDGMSQDFRGTTLAQRPDWLKSGAGAMAVWQASYTDFGGGGMPPLTRKDEIRLRSRLVEGEHFSSKHGTQTLESDTASNGQFVGSISPGHYLIYERVNLSGIKAITARIAAPESAGSIELRQNDPSGKLIAQIPFEATSGWEIWTEVEAVINDPGGLHHLCVVFVNPKGGGPFMNLDRLTFEPQETVK